MSKNGVIEIARGELGVTEYPPGSNRVKYWDEYDPTWQGQPWCVAGLWWVFKRAGESSAFFAGAKTASCGTLRRWYKEQGQAVDKNSGEPGDLVFLNFYGGNQPEHVGRIVERRKYGWYQTIEFNTSPGEEQSQDNGGCVALKLRHLSQIVEICRPEYKEDEMPKKTDYAEHWAEEDIAWAINKGLLTGYPDGTFRPDQPITRAELAAVLHRLEGDCK